MKKTLKINSFTPLDAYNRITGNNKIIFEHRTKNKEEHPFLILAYNPIFEIKFEDNKLFENNKIIDSDPFDYLNKKVVKKEKSDIPFDSGAIGFFGYDSVFLYEKIGKIPEDNINIPDIHFFLYDSYIIFDYKNNIIEVVEDNTYSKRNEEEQKLAIDKILKELSNTDITEKDNLDIKKLDFKSNTTKEEFCKMVDICKELIRNGDLFQVVISQRFISDFTSDPFDYFVNLYKNSTSKYIYFFDFTSYKIIGGSPESLVSLNNLKVTTNPIAGTRAISNSIEENKRLEEELKNDEKELAEHIMLVDLGRNDLSKISKVGSIKVTKFKEIEYFPCVMHLVSVVEGEILEEFSGTDALKATLVAGTVSGAPKIRAMQRIYELEKEKRGLYAGAIGYLSANGNMDFAIAIRTMLIKDKKAYVQAGAGIVYDSIPEKEYQESINKAKSMINLGENE